jgi:tRNA (guanine-N7-)-methyltransferase
VIELYGLFVVEESGDVYGSPRKAALDIKTHYEGLDIAQSNKIFYLQFALGNDIADLDEQLQEFLKQTENQNL